MFLKEYKLIQIRRFENPYLSDSEYNSLSLFLYNEPFNSVIEKSPNRIDLPFDEIASLCLIGAIAGDVIGSCYELKGCRTKDYDFEIFPPNATFTDDTVMTMAVTKWLTLWPSSNNSLIPIMQDLGRRYMNVGYGHSFKQWILSDNPQPYQSYGNGSAMRVAPVGVIGDNLEVSQRYAKLSAEVSHNHPDGIKAAEAVSSAIQLAFQGRTKQCIKSYIEYKYGYNLNRRIEDIRKYYDFDPTSSGSVPEAIICFLESEDYESSVRLAVSLGGDADTQACIAGAIAATYYRHIPEYIIDKMTKIIPTEFKEIIAEFISKNSLLEKTICYDRHSDDKELINAGYQNKDIEQD